MTRRVCILDVDGTLIDSNDAHARAWEETGEEQGVSLPFAAVRPLIGMGSDKLLPRVTGIEADSAEGERLSERRGELFRERHLPDLRAFPGARALLERLRDDGWRLVVATSASGDDRDALLERAGVADLIDDAADADDAEASKPDPDVVHAALRRAGAQPHEAVMLGDTPYDVEACVRAGVPCIALRCGGWRDDDLRGAVAIFDDPADLLAHFDTSPLAPR